MTRSRARQLLVALLVLALISLGVIATGLTRSALAGPAPLRLAQVAPLTVDTVPEPDGTLVTLDVDLYRPADTTAYPAVILGHGFGGSKASVAGQARKIAGQGYVVLTWSARGFGGSGGRIHLDDPALEGADVSTLVDVLAQHPDVLADGDDPRVAVAGASYGGAVALMAAAADDRIDSVVAAITWHDLADAFFPQAADSSEPGPFKATWASTFFTSVVAQSMSAPDAATSNAPAPNAPSPNTPPSDGPLVDPRCGRFDADVCHLFLEAAESGRPSAELLTLLHAHSPAAVLDRVDVPVYLVQGMTDSLFGIDQSQATAAALRERGVPVAQRWFDGGHDASGPTGLGGEVAAAQDDNSAAGPNSTGDTGNPGDQSLVGNSASEAASAESDAQDKALHTWLAATLGSAPSATSNPTTSNPTTSTPATSPAADGAQPLPALAYSLPRAPREELATLRQVPTAQELRSASRETSLGLSPSGPPVILSPPGGTPAALSTVPGAGAIGAGLAGYSLAALPTQSTSFDTAPLTEVSTIVGSPRVRLEVTSTGTQATLFLSLWQLPGNDRQPVAQRALVAPIRVATTPGQPVEVDVALPAGTYQAPVGARWRVLVSATDTAYRNSTEAAQLQVALADPELVVPTVDGTQVGGPRPLDGQSIALLAGLGVLWAALAAWAFTQRHITRRHDSATTTARPDLADVPLAVEGLTKAYPDGHQAVSDVRWQALRGQVVGLLGPNGAGKTTTLRMVMGLIRPDAGEVYLLGERVRPGADVLRRVGALVEGPGFLPHLSGRANLEAYWAATGRSHQEARLEEALDVAALGSAIDRPVKSYSHGMRQRLGIAQAMLGLPDVLILDEPTNGLDPPQIAALRPILHRYAEAGRCVVVSSHLLGEVQQTCSHIVVMDAGRVLVAGSVAEVGVNAEHTLEEVFMSTIDTSRGGHNAPDNERLRQVRPR